MKNLNVLLRENVTDLGYANPGGNDNNAAGVQLPLNRSY